MADTRISQLTALTSVATGDLIPIVDVSDTTDSAAGTTKKITKANLVTAVTEADQTLADNTTKDVSTSMHGYVPKAPNDTGKVLLGDGTWGYPTSKVIVRAYKSAAAQTITQDVATKVTFDVETFDTNSNFATSTFTASIAGYYSVTAKLDYSSAETAENYEIHIYKNGSAYSYVSSIYITAEIAVRSVQIHDIVSLAVNDTIDIYTLHNSTGTKDISAGTGNTFVSIYKI